MLQIAFIIALSVSFWNLTCCGTNWLEPNIAEDVCLSKECIITGITRCISGTTPCQCTTAKFAENLDTSVDPCKNFYKFSCGGFEEKNLPVIGYYDMFLSNSYNSKTKVKILLQTPHQYLHGRYDKMKEFYDSCMDTASIKELGVKPLRQLLDKYGGWPLLKGARWDEKKFDWARTLFQIYGDGLVLKDHKLENSQILFELKYFDNSDGDAKSKQFILPQIVLPDKPLLKSNVTDVRKLSDYKMSVELAVILGANRKYAEDELEKTYIFVQTLAEALNDKSAAATEETDHDSEYPRKVSRVTDLYLITDKVEWIPLLELVFSEWISVYSEIAITGRRDLFPTIVDTFNEAPKRVISNLILEALARRYVGLVESKDWRDVMLKLSKKRPQLQSRKTICLSETDHNFLPILNSMHARNYFSPRDKRWLNDTFSSTKMNFKKLLDDVNWLTPETLQNAKDKLNELRAFLIYPDEVLNDAKLADYYQDLKISSGDYFMNFIRVQRFRQVKKSDHIDRYEQKMHWDDLMSLFGLGAYYREKDNTIVVQPAFVRGLYFDFKDFRDFNRLQALNFGSIGSVIGHELLHAFNVIGREESRIFYTNKKWWREEDTKTFLARAECSIKQYDNYGIPLIRNHNGTDTLDENIADNVGAILAYRIYRSRAEKYGSGKRLPGLALNSNQLFWVAFANNWCISFAIEKIKNPAVHRPDSLHPFRVIGTVTNSKEFSEDFNCPVGSPMNPEKKCSVW